MVLSRAEQFIGLILVIIILGSCKKEKAVEKTIESFQLPTSLNITDIEVEDSTGIWCTVGIRFGEGGLYHSSNNAVDWTKIISHPQEINDIDFYNNELILYPWGNKILISSNQGQTFSTKALPGWGYYAAGARTVNNSYMVAGENFGSGLVLKFNHNTTTTAIDTIQHELTDIHCWNDSSCIATGYGVILKTTNSGEDWVPAKARGDFYKAIDFADEQTAYVVGDYGSIWKTTNRGDEWKKIRAGSTLMNTNNRLIDVDFRNAEEGVIAGKNGLCWLTYNGGDSWIPVKDLPKEDFFSVKLANNQVYLGSTNGMIYKFEF